MSKFNDKVAQLALEVGGSHYPSVNPDLHDKMVRAVIKECLLALDYTNHDHVYTSFDKSQFDATMERVKIAINERFGL